jgi:putative FmdB family regulatory protein
VPIYEFECRSCRHRFEELVGSQVGVQPAEVRCPECGAPEPERVLSSQAPVSRRLTPNQKRRLEDERGIDRGGAKERFRKQRAAERRAGSGGRGG